jgi:hypothetical protein
LFLLFCLLNEIKQKNQQKNWKAAAKQEFCTASGKGKFLYSGSFYITSELNASGRIKFAG